MGERWTIQLIPYGHRIEDLPYESELVAIDSSALVRPNPEGSGNDVIYELAELSDGTFIIASVSYCIEKTAQHAAAARITSLSVRLTQIRHHWPSVSGSMSLRGLLLQGCGKNSLWLKKRKEEWLAE